jgi:glyoxylate/hydroxypyruvate reductase
MASSDVASAKALPALLLIRRVDAAFGSALRERFRVLDFFASGEPLPAFLAAAAALPEPPRAAVVMGGGPVRGDAAFLDAVPSLRCVVSTAAGVDHIDLDECAPRGVVVANSGSVYSTDVADHAVGLLIDVLRRLMAAGRFVRRGLWAEQGECPLVGSGPPALSLLSYILYYNILLMYCLLVRMAPFVLIFRSLNILIFA